METALLAELRDLIARHIVRSGDPLAALPNVVLGREPGPTPPCAYVAEPVFSLIAQGTKQIEFGEHSLTYGAGQGMAVSVELPMNSFVRDASPDTPFLGIGLCIRAEAVAALLLERDFPVTSPSIGAGVLVGDAPPALVDAIVRLLRLLDSPADIAVLAPAIEREILWRLLNSPQGDALRQIGLADSHTARIARALQWLRTRFAEPIRVQVLADLAGMSETSFHRHFRQITGMTPVQYQKQLRLHAARARLLGTSDSITRISFAVGYDSPSQFSREYRRHYGQSPGRDGRQLRAAAMTAPAAARGGPPV